MSEKGGSRIYTKKLRFRYEAMRLGAQAILYYLHFSLRHSLTEAHDRLPVDTVVTHPTGMHSACEYSLLPA